MDNNLQNNNRLKDVDQQIVEQVTEEIKKFGSNVTTIKEQQDALAKSHKQLQDELKNVSGNVDALTALKIDKLASDVAARQEILDGISNEQKQAQERMDAIEVALARPAGDTADGEEKAKIDEALAFQVAILSAKGMKPSFEIVQALEPKLEEMKGFEKQFNRYLRRGEKGMAPENQKLLMVGSDADGGYTVTPAMASKIIERLYETSPIRQLANVENISTDAIEWFADWDEAGAEWVSETVAATNETTPILKKIRIDVHELATRPKATQQLLEDPGIDIEAWLARKVADKFARTENTAFVSGDGVGKPTGFLSYANGTSFGQIEQVNMGAAATLTADGFIDVKYALKEFFLNRGTWLMERATVAAAMKLKNGSGDYIWKPSLISGDPTSTICGLPVRMADDMPTVAANALAVALADWREAYTVVDRLGITIQRDPYTAKPAVEFYTRKRVGGGVLNWEAIKIGKIAV